jgi:hypothetical protein
MDDTACRAFFAQPTNPCHRRYEALRAVFVDSRSPKDVAEQFCAPQAGRAILPVGGSATRWKFGTFSESGPIPWCLACGGLFETGPRQDSGRSHNDHAPVWLIKDVLDACGGTVNAREVKTPSPAMVSSRSTSPYCGYTRKIS